MITRNVADAISTARPHRLDTHAAPRSPRARRSRGPSDDPFGRRPRRSSCASRSTAIQQQQRNVDGRHRLAGRHRAGARADQRRRPPRPRAARPGRHRHRRPGRARGASPARSTSSSRPSRSTATPTTPAATSSPARDTTTPPVRAGRRRRLRRQRRRRRPRDRPRRLARRSTSPGSDVLGTGGAGDGSCSTSCATSRRTCAPATPPRLRGSDLSALDANLDTLSGVRAEIGAGTNRLESAARAPRPVRGDDAPSSSPRPRTPTSPRR